MNSATQDKYKQINKYKQIIYKDVIHDDKLSVCVSAITGQNNLSLLLDIFWTKCNHTICFCHRRLFCQNL